MSNPFNDDDSDCVAEGFLCPVCKADQKTPDRLTAHFEKHQEEDKDLLKSFKDIFKKIRYFDEGANAVAPAKSAFAPAAQHILPAQPQLIGADLDHFSYFKAIRTPRLERYATETNKLIIRLHKLLTDRPGDSVQRKQHEQTLVPWLDGKSVKLCPNCARKFNLTRRQHHCRLCGCIMCHDCSQFLAIPDAISLVNPSVSTPTQYSNDPKENRDDNAFRVCEYCLHLLENRKDMQDSQSHHPPITVYYDKVQQLKTSIGPDILMYTKIIGSLYDGDSIFTLVDAGALRSKIGHAAEKIDAYSKAILSLECEKGCREDALKKSVRLACIQYIKDEMLSLEALPLESDIAERQRKRKQETEQRIERERRLAMERWERSGDGNDSQTTVAGNSFASGSAITSIDNWSGRQADTRAMNDPLVEQINIIKGYIKQARDAMRFEEVITLELNLRELQQEFYRRQQTNSTQSPTVTNKRHTEY